MASTSSFTPGRHVPFPCDHTFLKFTSPGWTEFVTGTTTVALHATRGEKSTAAPSLPPSGQAQLGFMVDDLQATYEALKALDVFFSKDFVQYLDQRAIAHSRTETGAALWNREQLSEHSSKEPVAA